MIEDLKPALPLILLRKPQAGRLGIVAKKAMSRDFSFGVSVDENCLVGIVGAAAELNADQVGCGNYTVDRRRHDEHAAWIELDDDSLPDGISNEVYSENADSSPGNADRDPVNCLNAPQAPRVPW